MTGRIAGLIPEPEKQTVAWTEALVRRIVDDVGAGRDCSDLIARIDAQAGSPGYTADTFASLHEWTSERDFAARAAMGRPPAVPDLTEEEVDECLRIVGAGGGPVADYVVDLLGNSFPGVPVSDLIFGYETPEGDAGLAAEIVRRGREARPILL